MGNRITFGSAQDQSILGPSLITDDQPYELGVCFWVKVATRITGARIYKHPDIAGSIPVTLWDDTGAVLATTTVTWVADGGGWRTVLFSSAVTVAIDREYRLSYFNPTLTYAYTPWVYNAQHYWEYPFQVRTFAWANGADVDASVIKAGSHGEPTKHVASCFYIDVLGEVEIDMPAHKNGYMNQWTGYDPSQAFPVAVFFADPEWIEDYASIGVNTLVGIPTGREDYRNPILNSGVDVWSNAPDATYAQNLLADPELAAQIVGWFVCDEPDLYGTWATPEEIRTVTNAIRSVDTTRPLMVNFGFSIAMGQGWAFLHPGGKDIVGHFDELIEDFGIADVISLDYYVLTPGASLGRYGPWAYGKFIDRLQQFSLGQRPVWGYVETASGEPGFPTPAAVKQAVWCQLIAGARGIVFFDHRFGNALVTSDFAAMLRDVPMKTMVQALSNTIQEIAGFLHADEAGLVTSVSSSNTTAPMLGATKGVPIECTSRISGGTSMVIAQSNRPGTTTGTFTVPSAANKTLIVRDESRTITANGSGVFTDDFASDYAVHIYTWTP
jgi:hypothetical protein